jgi:hypothetical protein
LFFFLVQDELKAGGKDSRKSGRSRKHEDKGSSQKDDDNHQDKSKTKVSNNYEVEY